jgi:ABC-type branched-subunit amino acid transport system substrate-binding protein
MMKAIQILGLTLAALWLPALALAQEKDGADSPAVFLLAVPERGPLAELGLKARQGAELALNIWGGGFKLEILNESQPDSLDEIDLGTVALVLGYFTEKRFAADASRYLYLRKPVLLPYLTNEEAAARGPGLFFRLMPTARDQGRFLALEILKLQRRPNRLLLITGAAPAQAALAEALTETLANPNQPLAALGGVPEEVRPSVVRAVSKPNIKPLDAKAQVVALGFEEALTPGGLARFGRNKPELVVLALDRAEALKLASRLAKDGYGKIPLWGALSLGFREVGAGFASLNLNLRLCLPAVNLAAQDNTAVREFIRQFIDAYKAHPTWISALAFDSLNLAVKAASSGEDAQGLVDFIAGGRHHGLASYDLGPEGDGSVGLALMPVRPANLGFLP